MNNNIRNCKRRLGLVIGALDAQNYGISKNEALECQGDLSYIEDEMDEMETEIDNLKSTVEEFEREPVELGPFTEQHFEAMNDMRKAELLAENWGKFTLEDVEKMLGI